MYWIGDSKWPIRRWLWRIPREIIQGYKDNIPFCCTMWYTISKLVTMFITVPIRTLLREKIGYGFSSDLIVFSIMFEGKLDKKKRIFKSDSFRRLQYWKCPLCRILKRENNLRWDTGTYWEYHSSKKNIKYLNKLKRSWINPYFWRD